MFYLVEYGGFIKYLAPFVLPYYAILVCACLGTNKSSPTASTLELHLDDLWAPWNRKESRGEEESREYCFLDCPWSVFWALVGFTFSKQIVKTKQMLKCQENWPNCSTIFLLLCRRIHFCLHLNYNNSFENMSFCFVLKYYSPIVTHGKIFGLILQLSLVSPYGPFNLQPLF